MAAVKKAYNNVQLLQEVFLCRNSSVSTVQLSCFSKAIKNIASSDDDISDAKRKAEVPSSAVFSSCQDSKSIQLQLVKALFSVYNVNFILVFI